MAVPLSITMGWRVRLWVQHPFGSYASIKIIKLIDRNIFVTVHMECFYIHIGLVKKKNIYIYIGVILRFRNLMKHLMTTELCQIECFLFNIIKLKEKGIPHLSLS